MVCGLVRQLLFLSNVWGLPLLVACQDVCTAFDTMSHDVIVDALLARGCSPQLACVCLRELTGIQAVATLPGAGTTQPFVFEKGGKQGGAETPEVWNAVIDYLLEPLVNSWEERRMGFSLGHSTTDFRIITHAVWADNVVVFASDSVALQQMLSELAQAIAEGRFRWKPSSLEVL